MKKYICPECFTENKDEIKLRFLREFSTQWGNTVTRYDVYRCKQCRNKFVTTNVGNYQGEPELAADWV